MNKSIQIDTTTKLNYIIKMAKLTHQKSKTTNHVALEGSTGETTFEALLLHEPDKKKILYGGPTLSRTRG